jgi:hypothetical protein
LTWLLHAVFGGVAQLRIHEVLRSATFAVLGALNEIEGEIGRTVRRILPDAWTAESFQWRGDREERRHLLSEQQNRNAALARMAATVREELGILQNSIAEDFRKAQQQFRFNVFVEFARRAADKAKEQIEEIAEKVMLLWKAPIDSWLRLGKRLSRLLSTDADSPGD